MSRKERKKTVEGLREAEIVNGENEIARNRHLAFMPRFQAYREIQLAFRLVDRHIERVLRQIVVQNRQGLRWLLGFLRNRHMRTRVDRRRPHFEESISHC